MEAAASVSTLNMSRQDWLEYRKRGIGGSDAAAVLGVSRFKGPFAVYVDKTSDMAAMDEPSPVMEMGVRLEEYVAELFTRESGFKVARRNRTYTSREHPCMLANIDRWVVGDKAGLECKTTTRYSWHGWDEGEVPPEYYWQCMHYMAVLGLDHWYLAVLMRDTGGFRWFRMERDDALVAQLIAEEEAFWDRVMRRNPPPASGLDSETDLINGLYPAEKVSPDAADLSGIAHMVASRADLDRDIKERKKTLEALDQQIKLTMGESQEGRSGNYIVSWKAAQRTNVDSKKLLREYPQVYAAVTTLTSYRTFSVKEAKNS